MLHHHSERAVLRYQTAGSPDIEQFVSLLTWYAATPAIARHAGRMRFEYARKGITLSLTDVLIAATALEHRLTWISDNRRHFPMPELLFYALPG